MTSIATPSFSGTSTLTMESEPKSGFVHEDMEVFQKPMCLVSTDRGNVLKLETEAVKQIAKIDWPIVVVSIVGPYRTGKSYLMNRLAGQCKGFVMGGTIESTTKGIWVWCKVHLKKPNTVLMLLDTEGLGDVKKGDTNHDNKMFTLATLLCNCLVYNMKGVFDQDAISKLTFISEMAKNIRYKGICSDDNTKLNMITPIFVLCLRDFSLKLSVNDITITEDEYLEQALAIQENKDVTFNKARESIKKYFPERRCFTFPVPGDGSVLQNIESLQDEALSDIFNEATARFVDHIHCCKAKELFCSKPLNGQMFAELADNYVTTIRNGAVPDVDDAFSAVAKSENTRARKTAFGIFKTEMRAFTLPALSADLDEHHKRSQQTALDYLRKNVVYRSDVQFELEIQNEMDIFWNKIKGENTQKVGKMCDDKLQQPCRESIKAKIENGVYAVPGGYTKFQRDIANLKKYFFSSLRGYEKNETLRTWYGFLEEIKPGEEKIIEDDETLSKREKEDDRRRYEELVTMLKENQNYTINALKEQRQKSEERDKQLHRERLELLTKHQQEYVDHCKTKLEKEEMVKESKELENEIEEKIEQLVEVQKRENIRQEDEFKRQLEETERQHEKLTRKLLSEVQEKENIRREKEFKRQLEETKGQYEKLTRQRQKSFEEEKRQMCEEHNKLERKNTDQKEENIKREDQLKRQLEETKGQHEKHTRQLKESFEEEKIQIREEHNKQRERKNTATRKSLQEEYIRIKVQLNCSETEYKQASNKVQEVANEYVRCRRHFLFRRYGELRNMIEGCTGYGVSEISFQRCLGVSNSCDDLQYSYDIRHEIEGMKNTKLEELLEETKRQLADTYQHVNQFNMRFAELERCYEQSKSCSHLTQYRAMKNMLKYLIRNSPQKYNEERVI